ncbi:MAG: ribokinase [Streptosporangiaceae bacterium]
MAAGRVVVVGSINLDLVIRLPRLPAPGETVLGGVLTRQHGGKGANQAVAAATAGARVYLVGAVGAADGQDSIDALATSGVDVSWVRRCDEPTGIAVVQIADGTGENQIVVAPGANTTVSADDVEVALSALDLGPDDVVVLSRELPDAPLRLAADLAGRTGSRLVVNPAPADPDCVELLAGAVATPNEGELGVLTGEAGLPTAEAAVTLSARTGGSVAVTLGARGALLAGAGHVEHFAAHPVEVRDTTGAGDTLTGVLAASLAQGDELRTAVRRGVAAAGLAVTRDGARAGMPTARQIDQLLAP